MRRGSTPTHTFAVNIDLREAREVYVTYAQGGKNVLEKSKADMEITHDSLTLRLSQEDTLLFKQGTVEMQVRYVMPDGAADASSIMQVPAERILKEGVI